MPSSTYVLTFSESVPLTLGGSFHTFWLIPAFVTIFLILSSRVILNLIVQRSVLRRFALRDMLLADFNPTYLWQYLLQQSRRSKIVSWTCVIPFAGGVLVIHSHLLPHLPYK